MTYRSTTPRTTYPSTLGDARCPHYAQARTWYRYAKRLRSAAARSTCPSFNPHLLKEEALAHSLRLRTRGFVLPATLELTPEAESGLRKLEHWTRQRGEARGRAGFPELVARVAVTDPDDPAADEVHLFLEEPDRTSSRGRTSFIGRLPQAHALWVAPLLRLETDAYGTGPPPPLLRHRKHRPADASGPQRRGLRGPRRHRTRSQGRTGVDRLGRRPAHVGQRARRGRGEPLRLPGLLPRRARLRVLAPLRHGPLRARAATS